MGFLFFYLHGIIYLQQELNYKLYLSYLHNYEYLKKYFKSINSNYSEETLKGKTNNKFNILATDVQNNQNIFNKLLLSHAISQYTLLYTPSKISILKIFTY